MEKKIYRTIIQYEILSDVPYNGENLSEIAYETFEGSWSGEMQNPLILNEELTSKKAIEAIKNQCSSPEFFGF